MTINQIEKSTIRQKVKDLKKKYSFEDLRKKSKALFEKIEHFKQFQESKVIFIYWSMPDEVYTHDFIVKWSGNKQFLLPVIVSEKLIIKKFNGVENLEKGKHFKILEPKGDCFTEFEQIDLAIIPGIAFDRENNRLGRGKAYYDRFLKKIKSYKLGICFDFQMFDKIPSETHDIKMDKIIFG